MNYSEDQQQDMLHLRRLVYGKLGQLSRVRAAIMAHMPADGHSIFRQLSTLQPTSLLTPKVGLSSYVQTTLRRVGQICIVALLFIGV